MSIIINLLTGITKLRDAWPKINQNFTNIKTEVGAMDARVDTIITTPAEGVSAEEIVDARVGEGSLGAKIRSTDSQLAGKATVIQTDGIQTQVNNLVLGAVGDGNNAEVIQARSVYPLLNTRLDKVDLSLAETTKVQKSKNLFNKKNVTYGNYLKYNTGVLTVDITQALSDYIPANASTSYVRTTASHTTFWDLNKNYISGVLTATFTTPTNAKYIRISTLASTIANEQLEIGSVASSYESYGDLLVNERKTSIEPISPTTIKGVAGVNLFDKTTVTDNVAISNWVEITNTEFALSDFIPIEPLTDYAISYGYTNSVHFYDADKYVIDRITVTGYNITFTAPARTCYMRINVRKTVISTANFMAVKGTVLPVSYVPYEMTIDWLKLKDESVEYGNLDAYMKSKVDSISTNKWVDKTFVIFGDSITNYDGLAYNEFNKEAGTIVKGYQSYMREALGCIAIKQGYAGHRMPQILPYIKAYDYTNVDAVTITSGANDFMSTAPIGTVQPIGSVFDETSFVGAFQSAVEYIMGFNPEIKIYLITPVKGWDGDVEMPIAYADGIKEVAKLYSISACDWYYESGINKITKTVYIGDLDTVGSYLHPSTKGYERMANILIPFLENN